MADEQTEVKIAGNLGKKKMGHKCCAAAKCNSRSDNRPDLSFHKFPKDADLKKKWEIKMRRADVNFKNIANKFCCSAHFLPSDFKQSLTGHRRDLKKGAIPSVFEWAPVTSDPRGERLKLRSKLIVESEQEIENEHCEKPLAGSSISSGKDMVVFGPATLEEFIDEKREEAEQLKEELARAKEKEYLFKFGLERFSGSSEDINFYTGFPDYETLIEFWKYIEPNSSRLTYYSYLRNYTNVNFNNVFPYLNLTEKKFPNSRVGAQRSLQPIDEFWLFLTRLRVGLLENDLAFRFNISVPTVSDIIITWSNYMYVMLGSLPVWASREVIKLHLPEAFRGQFENVRCIIDCTEIV